MTTEIVPVVPEPTPPSEEVAAPALPPKKKRRGWLIALVVVGVLVILAVIAVIIGETVAKAYARDYVRERIVAVLQLPEDAEVEVDLGGGSIILQALAGRVDTVDVHVPQGTFGELEGSVRLHAEGVPLEDTAEVEQLAIDFAIQSDDLAALTQGDDPATAPTVELVDGEVAFSAEFELFGSAIPWGLSLQPSAEEGALVLSPTTFTLGEQSFEAGVDDGSFLGQIAAAFLQPQTLCVADQIPQALVLTDAAVDDEELVLTFTGDGAALGGPEFQTLGVCPVEAD
jgi:hypothetical protein